MTDEERDALLVEIRDTQREHGERLERIERDHGGMLDALSNQIHDVARAVRELGGDVDEPPAEATG